MSEFLEILTDRATGQVLQTSRFNADNEWHAEEGPAFTQRDPKTGALRVEMYMHKGYYHRVDGPAITEYFPEDGTVVETHARHGEVHRDPRKGPAVIKRSLSNRKIVLQESYYSDGRGYRDPAEGPWRITRDPTTGETTSMEYLTAADFHAKEGPGTWSHGTPPYPAKCSTIATTVIDGRVIEEEYEATVDQMRPMPEMFLDPTKHASMQNYICDILETGESEGRFFNHREDGPARLYYDYNTQQLKEAHYLQFDAHHRDADEGPAVIIHHEHGTREIFAMYGSLCRSPLEKAWEIKRDLTGKVVAATFLTEEDRRAARFPSDVKLAVSDEQKTRLGNTLRGSRDAVTITHEVQAAKKTTAAPIPREEPQRPCGQSGALATLELNGG